MAQVWRASWVNPAGCSPRCCSNCPICCSICSGPKLGHAVGKVLYGVVIPSPLHQADADRIHLRIEDIGPVRSRVHPLLFQRLRARRHSDVLRNRTEMRTGGATPGNQVRLAGILVRQRRLLAPSPAHAAARPGPAQDPTSREPTPAAHDRHWPTPSPAALPIAVPEPALPPSLPARAIVESQYRLRIAFSSSYQPAQPAGLAHDVHQKHHGFRLRSHANMRS